MVKFVKNNKSVISLTSMIMIFFSTHATLAQLNNPWEISVDSDMPDITTIKPNETGERRVPLLRKVQKIWDESLSGLPYNAFTDLIRFNDCWYCTFREGEVHEWSDAGGIRILKSKDGNVWKSVALLRWNEGDLRDPKFSITAEGQLMVNSAVIFKPPETPLYFKINSLVWLSPDGENWSSSYSCRTGINSWRWSVTWNKGLGFSLAYHGKDSKGTLYMTTDGKTWEVLAENIFPCGKGNEASIDFGENDKAYCLLRDGPGGMAHIGVAKPPYNDWKWTDLGMYAGGPEIKRLKDGRLLAVVRLHEGGLPPSATMPGLSSNLGGGRTSLCWIDPNKGLMKEFLTLPSGGHGGHSYAGIVEYEGMIWISYYSSHENTTEKQRPAIYLAKVKLDKKKNTSE
ncbi:MAG TPA: hypothetical protein DDW27_13335 [Bacteroidales bacterium]|nr:hypothetical protein [Bacteroidales bacterium]